MTEQSGCTARSHFTRESQLRTRNLLRQIRIAHASREQGSSIVEMALASVVLLTMLFGMMEISLAVYTYHFISEAAREGTRDAIVRGSACTGFSADCPATKAQIQTYVQQLGYPGINSSAMTVVTTYSAYPAGGACSPSMSCNNPGNMVQVTVNYQYPVTIPFIPATTLNMSSSSQMVISQ